MRDYQWTMFISSCYVVLVYLHACVLLYWGWLCMCVRGMHVCGGVSGCMHAFSLEIFIWHYLYLVFWEVWFSYFGWHFLSNAFYRTRFLFCWNCLNLILSGNVLYSPSIVLESFSWYFSLDWHLWFKSIKHLLASFWLLKFPLKSQAILKAPPLPGSLFSLKLVIFFFVYKFLKITYFKKELFLILHTSPSFHSLPSSTSHHFPWKPMPHPFLREGKTSLAHYFVLIIMCKWNFFSHAV